MCLEFRDLTLPRGDKRTIFFVLKVSSENYNPLERVYINWVALNPSTRVSLGEQLCYLDAHQPHTTHQWPPRTYNRQQVH